MEISWNKTGFEPTTSRLTFYGLFRLRLESKHPLVMPKLVATPLGILTVGSKQLKMTLTHSEHVHEHFTSRGAVLHRGSILASHAAALGSIPGLPKSLFPCCWDLSTELVRESGHKLENVDKTHLVLACGKPELQKRRRTLHFKRTAGHVGKSNF